MAIVEYLNNKEYIELYRKENIQILGTIAIYESLFQGEYKTVEHVKILKDDKIVYDEYAGMAYNKEGLVSFEKYIYMVATYLRYNTDHIHWQRNFLDKFFKDKRTLRLESNYQAITKQLKEEKRLQDQKEKKQKIERLKQQIKSIYNSKNYICEYSFIGIYVVKNDSNKDPDKLNFNYDLIDKYKNEEPFKSLIVTHVNCGYDNKTIEQLEMELNKATNAKEVIVNE